MESLNTKDSATLIKKTEVEINFAGKDNAGIKKYQCKLNNGNWSDCTD